MAMRHPKSTVLSGALTALIVMTVSCPFFFCFSSFYFSQRTLTFSDFVLSLSLSPFFLLTLQGIEWNGPASNYTELFLFSMLVKLKAVVHVI
jgi:putative Ca2+/H+ antiporter (TMEM165/GDT1 family)